MIEILRPGPLATVQDLGRPGYAHLGVGRSGAADRGALRLANRLVGNAASAAAIELTLGGLTFRAGQAMTVALTGAGCPGPLGWGAAVSVRVGDLVELGHPARGLRSYLAVRGGIDVPPVLGSRSTDVLSGVGPSPLRAGDVLAIGALDAATTTEVSGGIAAPPPHPPGLRVIAGPRADWFSDDAMARLTGTGWQVRPDSNRIGVRLGGGGGMGIVRIRPGELATEATLPGAIQVPPDGQPILLGPDSPVTGGYPVIAVVIDADLDAAGQLRPGDEVRFALRGTTPDRPDGPDGASRRLG